MKKHLFFGMLAMVLLLAFSLVFAGCDSGSSDSGTTDTGNTVSGWQGIGGTYKKPGSEPKIDYTVTEKGGFEDLIATKQIIIEFEKPIVGTFDGEAMTLSGDGLFLITNVSYGRNEGGAIIKYIFDVLVFRQGSVNIKINKYGVVTTTKSVMIYNVEANNVAVGDPIAITLPLATGESEILIPGGFPMNGLTISGSGTAYIGAEVTFEGTTTIGNGVTLFVGDASLLKGAAGSQLNIDGILQFPTNTPPSFDNFADGAKIVTSDTGAWLIGPDADTAQEYIGVAASGAMFEIGSGGGITVEIKNGKPEFQLRGGITANAMTNPDPMQPNMAWIGPAGTTFVVPTGANILTLAGTSDMLYIAEGAELKVEDAGGLVATNASLMMIEGTLNVPQGITLANFPDGSILTITYTGKLINILPGLTSNPKTYIGAGGDIVLATDNPANVTEQAPYENFIVMVMTPTSTPVFALTGNATIVGEAWGTKPASPAGLPDAGRAVYLPYSFTVTSGSTLTVADSTPPSILIIGNGSTAVALEVAATNTNEYGVLNLGATGMIFGLTSGSCYIAETTGAKILGTGTWANQVKMTVNDGTSSSPGSPLSAWTAQ